MEYQLHHIALSVHDLDWHKRFFETVFKMHISKASGEIPYRKIWYQEGIQLNETTEFLICNNLYDHIAITTTNTKETITLATNLGCRQISENWFELPSKIRIELIQL